LDLGVFHDTYGSSDQLQTEGRKGAGRREGAKEACGQEHDGSVEEDGGIFEVSYR